MLTSEFKKTDNECGKFWVDFEYITGLKTCVGRNSGWQTRLPRNDANLFDVFVVASSKFQLKLLHQPKLKSSRFAYFSFFFFFTRNNYFLIKRRISDTREAKKVLLHHHISSLYNNNNVVKTGIRGKSFEFQKTTKMTWKSWPPSPRYI